MSSDSKLLNEAQNVVSTGSKTFNIFIVAILIWWLANLFPYNYSERVNGTAARRLDELSWAAQRANDACHDVITNYVSYRYQATMSGPGQKCLALRSGGSPGEIFAKLDSTYKSLGFRRALSQISDELDEANKGSNCTKEQIDGLRKDTLGSCLAHHHELMSFVDDWSKQGNLDLLGLKINNIHPMWHPLVLLGLIALGAISLAAQRRRALYFFDAHCATLAKTDEGPLLLSAPWWLWPIPSWTYPSGISLRDHLLPPSELARARRNALIVVGIVLVMFASAIIAQKSVSAFNLSPIQAELAGLSTTSFSVSGNPVADLFALSLLLCVAIPVLWWNIPLRRSSPASDEAQVSRRVVVARGALAVAAAALLSVAIDPAASARLVNNALKKTQLATRNPRRRRPRRRFIVHDGEPGWYRNKRSAPNTWVGHYAKPAFAPARRSARISWLGRKTPRAEPKALPAGRIAGAGKLDPIRLEPLAASELPARRPASRLNTRYYSDGIEAEALKTYRAGDVPGAIAILQVGLTYAVARDRVDVRLFDLLAVIAVRNGKEAELNSARNILETRIAAINARLASPATISSQSPINPQLLRSKRKKARLRKRMFARNRLVREKDQLQRRLAKWTDSEGRWRKKWSRTPHRKWNHIDI